MAATRTPGPAEPPADTGETASSARPGRARPLPATLRLVVVYPHPHAGTLLLTADATTIGRQHAPGVAFAVGHPTVSRQHATLRWDPTAGRHAVVDLGSRNGTFLDGKPVGALPKFLADASVLRIGDVLAVYERAEATVVDPPDVARDALPGHSLAPQQLRVAVARVGPERSPALISGETGVGKENVAGELHRLSRRRGPFIAVNCAAISPQLFESQLFGHVKGAFTGATTARKGLIEEADGGTFFFDEIAETTPAFQAKLLRTLQEVGRVSVFDGATPVDQLNELEFVNGKILANIYQTDRIAQIDPYSGKVTGWINLSGLLKPEERGPDTEVLNGIAYDANTDRLFVTGKRWPLLFQITLKKASQPLAANHS